MHLFGSLRQGSVTNNIPWHVENQSDRVTSPNGKVSPYLDGTEVVSRNGLQLLRNVDSLGMEVHVEASWSLAPQIDLTSRDARAIRTHRVDLGVGHRADGVDRLDVVTEGSVPPRGQIYDLRHSREHILLVLLLGDDVAYAKSSIVG